jgi:hypothetical protein
MTVRQREVVPPADVLTPATPRHHRWAAALVVIGGTLLLSFTSIATQAALGSWQPGSNSGPPGQEGQAGAGALLHNLQQYRHQLQGASSAEAAAALPLLMALEGDAGSAGEGGVHLRRQSNVATNVMATDGVMPADGN